jgi:hypothetical protein
MSTTAKPIKSVQVRVESNKKINEVWWALLNSKSY